MPVIPQVFRRRREEDRDSRAVWAKVWDSIWKTISK
jgi:hypothetical protein